MLAYKHHGLRFFPAKLLKQDLTRAFHRPSLLVSILRPILLLILVPGEELPEKYNF